MIISKYVTTKWNNYTKNYYESLGYIFTSYNDTFTVSVSDLPEKSGIKVLVQCDCCGTKKEIAYFSYMKHTKKHNGKYYCHGCCNKKSDNKPILTEDEIIRRVESKNNNKILNPNEYINIKTKNLVIKCGTCGNTFLSSLSSLENGGGRCRKCGYEYEKKNNTNRHRPIDIIKIAKSLDINILNPEDYIDSNTSNLNVVCKKCGDIFTTYLYRLKDGQKFCKKCRNCVSIGEEQVQLVLEKNQILYEKEKWYPDCRDQKPLPFDFYLPKYNTLIEFDGQHHFEPTFGEENLKSTQKHDKIKNNYCEENNIKLIRIPYWEGNNMETIIKNELNIA